MEKHDEELDLREVERFQRHPLVFAKFDALEVGDLLLRLRGIGRWTAEYVLLRSLGRIGVFPGDDVGARNRLAQWLGREGPMDYETVRRAVRRWHPYSGFVYFHLLLEGLAQSKSLLEDRTSNVAPC